MAEAARRAGVPFYQVYQAALYFASRRGEVIIFCLWDGKRLKWNRKMIRLKIHKNRFRRVMTMHCPQCAGKGFAAERIDSCY